jgi:hypothetical protein
MERISMPHPRPRSLVSIFATFTLLAGLLAAVPAPASAAPATPPAPVPAAPDFGPNVTVFSPADPLADIQAKLDARYATQVDNEMGTGRYAFYFLPGTYGTATQPLQIKVGYYTEIAGLGANPDDVVINGKIEVYNRCLADGGTSNCLALVNFWRTLGNLKLQINAAGQDGCRGSANFWAVSQAASLRRVHVTGGNLSLMDYCTAGPQYASGGFIADSQLPFVVSGSQQQWLTRNSSVDGWSNAVWNQVFSGVDGAPADATFPDPPYTTVAKTPVSREKPYLYVDGSGKYLVRVPSAHKDSSGTSWSGGLTPGRSIPLSDFSIARPGDPAKSIVNALARGRNLLFTPGVYDIDRTLDVKRANTVVLGMGHATLTSARGATPMQVADAPGIVVAGITFDAGPMLSQALLRVGKSHGNGHGTTATNPITLSDVYFRVGGPHIGRTRTALELNADHVLVDHIWVWRADHGVEGFTQGVNGDTDRWNTNTGTDGFVVNGDDVTATGVFVEHFQRYNTLWKGERGRVIFYQNELAYDPPTQADWTQPDGTLGYPGYKVADSVRRHSLAGAGVYVFNQNNPSIVTASGFEVPGRTGVRLHHVMTVNLSAGTIVHVVNDTGGTADATKVGVPQFVVDYPTP